MTAEELYREYLAFADDAEQSYLPPARFLKLYWVCQIDWLKAQIAESVTDKTRGALRPFRAVLTSAGPTVDLSLVTPALLAIRAVLADFDAVRTGISVTPVDDDELGERQLDPFRKGTNDDPIYCEEAGRILTIYSSSPPVRTEVRYIRYPVRMVSGGATLLEGEDSRVQILRRVVAEKDLSDEKYNRYQLLAQGIIPKAEQAT